MVTNGVITLKTPINGRKWVTGFVVAPTNGVIISLMLTAPFWKWLKGVFFFGGGTYQITLCLTGYLKPLQVDRCDVASTTPLMLTSSWQKLKKSTAVSLGIREPPRKLYLGGFKKNCTCGNDPIWRAYFSNGLKPAPRYAGLLQMNLLSMSGWFSASMLVFGMILGGSNPGQT